jgi:hypothetical protein
MIMKSFALILLALTLAIGTYLNRKDSDKDARVMIEDSVGSTLAAPIKPNIPL